MLDRPRSVFLAWAAGFAALFGVLAYAVTQLDRYPLDDLDAWGRDAEDWADDHSTLRVVLRIIEDGFGTIGMAVLTVVVAGALLINKQRRAAIYSVAVMVTVSAITTGLKIWLSRDRPDWQDPTDTLSSKSFPSGHASGMAALAGILIVLSVMLLRRQSLRRASYTAITLLVVAVSLDRILLGRHYPTDTVGGTLIGAVCAIAWLAIYNPLPRSHAANIEPLPEVYSSQRRLAAVLNPIKVEDVGQFRDLVNAMAEESGWSEPRWHYTTIEDPGAGMAAKASVDGADLVLVCGGDGTVREVCAELAGTGIPVGIVPAGTGNLLARNLDIPLYIRSAIDVALNGQDRAIDLVDVSGDGLEDTHFMVMAGMGFDAALMEGVNDDLKAKVGWMAYVVSGLRSLRFPAAKFEIQVDDLEMTTHRARTVVVGNVGFLQAGMPLLPDASIDDGLLDVVILHPKRFLSWIPLALRVLSKGQKSDELIHRLTGARVSIRASADTPRQLDGDSVGAGRELRMECVHGRLLVRVPR